MFANIKETGLQAKNTRQTAVRRSCSRYRGNIVRRIREGFMRFSCANSLDNIKEAVKRIEKFNEKILKEAKRIIYKSAEGRFFIT